MSDCFSSCLLLVSMATCCLSVWPSACQNCCGYVGKRCFGFVWTLLRIKRSAYAGFADDVISDDVSVDVEVHATSGWPGDRPVRPAHGTLDLHISRCAPSASPLLSQAITFFLFIFASIASSELPPSLLHPKPNLSCLYFFAHIQWRCFFFFLIQ